MFARLRDKLRTLGWADTLWFTTDRVLGRMSFGSARFIKYYVIAQPVAEVAPSPVRKPGDMQLYVGCCLDDTIRQAARPIQALEDRFAQGSRCVVAERSGTFAGFIWLCPDTYREDTLRCVYRWAPAEAAVWDFDVFVAPPFRMGRLFARLWERAHSLLAAENVRWTLSRIDAFNAGSLAAHRKLGAREIARAWFLIVGACQLTLCTVAPRWHFSFREADAPQITFDLSQLDRPAERRG